MVFLADFIDTATRFRRFAEQENKDRARVHPKILHKNITKKILQFIHDKKSIEIYTQRLKMKTNSGLFCAQLKWGSSNDVLT